MTYPAGVVVAMAPGTDTDYVCRFFGPAMGIPEDPVTGSIEMCMIPFWRKRLGKDELTDRQLSPRGGIKYLRYKGDRVQIGGRVDMYLIGEILDKTEVAQRFACSVHLCRRIFSTESRSISAAKRGNWTRART